MQNYPQIFYPDSQIVAKDIIDYKKSRSGFTESTFERKLEKYFKGHILKSVILNDGKRNPYKPDYVFYYEKHNLYIDIEIDEPYVLRNKMPIHTDDHNRNNYFLKNGWSIIRFAEVQVARFPELCCKIIAEHIRNLTDENIWIEGFHQLEELAEVKAWNIEEAQEMASTGFRFTYLKYLKKINEQKADINVIADGIFLNTQIEETKQVLRTVPEIESFNESPNISLFLKLLLQYVHHFKVDKKATDKVYIEVTIFISQYHSFYNSSFDTDFIELDNYIINVYYIRTGEIICFEIIDKIIDQNLQKVMLVADDPAYPQLLKEANETEFILVRKYKNSFMPHHYRYINIDNPIQSAMEIIYHKDS